MRALFWVLPLILFTAVSQLSAQSMNLPGVADSVWCGAPASSGSVSQIGGLALPSIGTIHALVIFIDFPDDSVDMGNSVWPVGLGPSYGSTIIDFDTVSPSNEYYNITTYFNEMSFGQLRVVGHPYYVQALHPLTWYKAHGVYGANVEYWARRHVLEYIDTAAAYNVNYALFDRWTNVADYNNVNVPDGKVDLCFALWRRWYLYHPTNQPERRGFVWDGWYPDVGTPFTVEGGAKSFVGLSTAVSLDMMNFPYRFGSPLHEFSHSLGLSHQYGNGVWSVMGSANENVSYFMNAYEREKLGWITIADIATDDTTLIIPDFGTTGVAYRLSVPGSPTSFILENHQGLATYDIVDVTSGGAPGLYILRQQRVVGGPGDTVFSLQIMAADGRWNWLNIGHAQNPWSSDPGFQIPVFKRDSVNRNTGRTDRQQINFSDPFIGADFLYKWLDPRSGDSVVGAPKAGDGKDRWKTGVATMFSPWSNPSSASGDTAISHLGVEVIEENGTNVYVTVYTTNPENGSPSRPQDLRCWAYIDSTGSYPHLTWSGNLEPDVTSGGGYQIWRRVEPLQVLIGTSWQLIDSVSGTATDYVDFSLDSADTVWAMNSVSYRIRAFDSTGKLSTNSEERGIYWGAGGGPHSPPKLIAHRTTEMAGEVMLWPNRPNPFGSTTEIGYSLTRSGRVTVEVYDAAGKRVAVLVDGAEQDAGSYRVQFDGRERPAGVYLCRVIANGSAVAKPIKLVR